jgi:ferrous iron transport protein B
LLKEISLMAARADDPSPRKLPLDVRGLTQALDKVESDLLEVFPRLPQPRWVALRLLEGDREIIDAVQSGEIGNLVEERTMPQV